MNKLIIVKIEEKRIYEEKKLGHVKLTMDHSAGIERR